MKINILSSISLDYCESYLRKIIKFSKLKFIINSRKKILNNIQYVDVYISGVKIKIDKEFLKKATNLKIILSPSTGTDHMDLKEIKKKKIKLIHIAKEYKLLNQFTATSEIVFGLFLSLNRKIILSNKSVISGYWPREKFIGNQLYGKTFGILGLGRLGKISAKIAKGFQMNVIAHDIKKIKTRNVKMVSLEKLFRLSDVLSIHTHLTPLTTGMINKKLLKLMKKNSTLINTSRGKIINESDLLNTLKNKKIAGAALDIIDGEWLNRKELLNHKLIKYSKDNDNLLIVPHIGGTTYESIKGAREHICKVIINHYENFFFKQK